MGNIMGNIINNTNTNIENSNFGVDIDNINYNIIHVTKESYEKLKNNPRGMFLDGNLSLLDAKYKSNNIKDKFETVYIVKIIY